jgi:hypothetical protein
MRERLDIFDIDHRYVIAWDDEGYAGTILGDKVVDVGLDPEHDAAVAAVRRCNTYVQLACDEFAWDSKPEAIAALKAARAAVRAYKAEQKAMKAARALPDWAKTALEHGWRPPKGWTA